MTPEARIAAAVVLVAVGMCSLWWIQRRWTSDMPTSKFVLPMLGFCVCIGFAARVVDFEPSGGLLAGVAGGVLGPRWWREMGA